MNDLRTFPASDTFRIRSGLPLKAGKPFPMENVVVSFWMGLDPAKEGEPFAETSSAPGGDVRILLEATGEDPAGIYVEVPASKIRTCKRGERYFWKVRLTTEADTVFTIDQGCVKFSDNVL